MQSLILRRMQFCLHLLNQQTTKHGTAKQNKIKSNRSKTIWKQSMPSALRRIDYFVFKLALKYRA